MKRAKTYSNPLPIYIHLKMADEIKDKQWKDADKNRTTLVTTKLNL